MNKLIPDQQGDEYYLTFNINNLKLCNYGYLNRLQVHFTSCTTDLLLFNIKPLKYPQLQPQLI